MIDLSSDFDPLLMFLKLWIFSREVCFRHSTAQIWFHNGAPNLSGKDQVIARDISHSGNSERGHGGKSPGRAVFLVWI